MIGVVIIVSKFALKLARNSMRPIVVVDSMVSSHDVSVLIDTGANVPVWVCSVEDLLFYYPDARYVMKTDLHGFGGNDKIVPVYKIPIFKFGDFTFLNFIVLVDEDESVDFDLIVCAPMFWGTNYGCDTIVRKKKNSNELVDFTFNVVYKHEDIVRHMEFKDGKLYVRCIKSSVSKKGINNSLETYSNLLNAFLDFFRRKGSI